MAERKRAFFTEMRRQEKLMLLAFIRRHKKKKLDKILGMYSMDTGIRISVLEVYVSEMKKAGVIA